MDYDSEAETTTLDSMAYAGPDKRKSSETTFGKVTVSYFKQNEYVAGDSMTSTLTIAIDTETD